MKSLGAKDSREHCLVDCIKEAGATGCEFHPQWGCSVHTKDVAAGSGESPCQCFVFSESGTYEQTYSIFLFGKPAGYG